MSRKKGKLPVYADVVCGQKWYNCEQNEQCIHAMASKVHMEPITT